MAIEHIYEMNAFLPESFEPPYPADANAILRGVGGDLGVFVPVDVKEKGVVGLLPAGFIYHWKHPNLWKVPERFSPEEWNEVLSYFERFSNENGVPLRIQTIRITRRSVIFYPKDVFLSTEKLFPPLPDIWGYPAQIIGRGKYGDLKVKYRYGIGIITKRGYKSATSIAYLNPQQADADSGGGFVFLSIPDGKPLFFLSCPDTLDAVYRLQVIAKAAQIVSKNS